VVRDLAAWADVVVESFAPGQMTKWGLDYASLSRDNPDLIMVSSSLMGQTGPHSRLAGFGSIGSAASGFGTLGGWPDRLPIGPFGPYTDYIAPRFALVSVLAALDHRRRTGQGCAIDLAQVETGVWFLAPELTDHLTGGPVAERMGNADLEMAPHGVYACATEESQERFVAIAVRTDAEWRRLADLIGRGDLAGDPRWSTSALRRASADLLDAAIEAWTRTRTAAQVERELQGIGVPAHVSAASRDYCEDPQLLHRGHFRTTEHPVHGRTTVEGPRCLLSETPGEVRRAAPTLGQHNEYVATRILGYSPARFAALVDAGVFT
jgi:benzylsuccinate CoA-transferase BbsF subunit